MANKADVGARVDAAPAHHLVSVKLGHDEYLALTYLLKLDKSTKLDKGRELFLEYIRQHPRLDDVQRLLGVDVRSRP